MPVAFAFGSGMVAAFNPCGAVMLPAYIGYQLGVTGKVSDPTAALLRGLYLGVVVTAGFVLFSLAVGLIITAGGDAVFNVIPFAGLGVGIGIVLVGLWLLISGRHLGLLSASKVSIGNERSTKNIFLFGVAYAVSSLGCAFPVFLATVGILAGQPLTKLELLPSLLRFVSYGMGMGMVLTTVTLGVVFFNEIISRVLRLVFPYVDIVGNLVLVGAGCYLIWYWILGDGRELLTLKLDWLF